MATANAFQVSTLVARTITEFNNNINYIYSTANRDFVEMFDGKTYSTGGTINVKVPGYPQVQRGLSVTPTAIQDLVVPLTITEDDIYSVTRDISIFDGKFNITGYDSALTEDVEERIVDNYAYPAFLALMADLEYELYYKLKIAAWYSPIDTVDSLGSINNFAAVQSVDTLMGQLRLPNMSRSMIFNYNDAANVSASLQNMFNVGVNEKVTKEAWIGGSADKGRLASLDCYRSNSFFTHEAGPLAGETDLEVVSVSTDGTQIVINGATASTAQLINAGDRISIPTITWLDPVSKNVLSTKVVVAAAEDANGDGTGSVTITLAYPLLASGEHANVSALPAVGASVYVFPDYNLNVAYTKSGLSVVPLTMPDIYGAANSDSSDSQGVPVKVNLQGQVTAYQNIFRISQMVGSKGFTPYLVALPSEA